MRKILRFLIAATLLNGCHYKFSNLHSRAPKNAHSIFIEAVYDSSRKVFPHEVLWSALQDAFARDGHLELRNPKKADLYLRTHITEFSLNPQGLESKEEVPIDKNNPELPEIHKRISQRSALSFYRTENCSLKCLVEIYDLRTQKKIYGRTYTFSGSFDTYDPSSPQSLGFLRREERFETLLQEKSQELARKIVDDFIRG